MSKKAKKLYLELSHKVADLEDGPLCAEPQFRDWFYSEGFIPQKGLSNAAYLHSVKVSEMSAKRICALCPLKQQCAEYAILANEEFGIWGGTTPEERRAISGARSTMLER